MQTSAPSTAPSVSTLVAPLSTTGKKVAMVQPNTSKKMTGKSSGIVTKCPNVDEARRSLATPSDTNAAQDNDSSVNPQEDDPAIVAFVDSKNSDFERMDVCSEEHDTQRRRIYFDENRSSPLRGGLNFSFYLHL